MPTICSGLLAGHFNCFVELKKNVLFFWKKNKRKMAFTSFLPVSRAAAASSPWPIMIAREAREARDAAIGGANPIVSAAADKAIGTDFVRVEELREGDVLIMLGASIESCLICTLALSPGSSHTGVVVQLDDGELWLGEAMSYHNVDTVVFPSPLLRDNRHRPTGVLASKLTHIAHNYVAADVYRPRITPEQQVHLRRLFIERMSQPYQRNTCAACLVGCGLPCNSLSCDGDADDDGIFCSKLVAQLFGEVGLMKERDHSILGLFWCAQCRRVSYNYRPFDMPRIIEMDRLGSLDGTQSAQAFNCCC